MTRIEKDIYEALKKGNSKYTLRIVAALYSAAHKSTHRVYSKIQWELLDARIRDVLGARGLASVKKEAFKV
jgi:hypothetical protein